MNIDWIIIDEIEPIPMFTEKQKSEIADVKNFIKKRVANTIVNKRYSDAIPWDDVYLTGGAIASLLQGEAPKDWDFYFKHRDAMNTFLLRLDNIKDEVADVSPKYTEFVGQNGKMITANSVTMNDKNSFITGLCGDEKYVKSQFDFLHCTPHYDIKEQILYISYNQYNACINKKLIVNNPKMVKQQRIIKFKERGYHSND